MVPALIILALWVALLAPGVVKWLRNHKPPTSVASFHRQLRLLERSGPKLVEPAYRLGGRDNRVTEWEAPPPPTRAARLVLLPTGANTKEPTTMGHDDRYQDRYEGRYRDPFEDPYAADEQRSEPAWDDPWAEPAPLREPPTRAHRTLRAPRAEEYDYDDELVYDDEGDAAPRVLSPSRAKSRRARIVVGLGAAIVLSFVFSFLPGLSILWMVSIFAVVALVGYLGLMFYAANAGLYGHDALERLTPVARTVISPYSDRSSRYDDDDGWESDRIAAAR